MATAGSRRLAERRTIGHRNADGGDRPSEQTLNATAMMDDESRLSFSSRGTWSNEWNFPRSTPIPRATTTGKASRSSLADRILHPAGFRIMLIRPRHVAALAASTGVSATASVAGQTRASASGPAATNTGVTTTSNADDTIDFTAPPPLRGRTLASAAAASSALPFKSSHPPHFEPPTSTSRTRPRGRLVYKDPSLGTYWVEKSGPPTGPPRASGISHPARRLARAAETQAGH